MLNLRRAEWNILSAGIFLHSFSNILYSYEKKLRNINILAKHLQSRYKINRTKAKENREWGIYAKPQHHLLSKNMCFDNMMISCALQKIILQLFNIHKNKVLIDIKHNDIIVVLSWQSICLNICCLCPNILGIWCPLRFSES